MQGRPSNLIPCCAAGILIVLSACGDDGPGSDVDFAAPAAVVDLAVTVVAADTALLTWTAPGDDSNEGRAFRYDIRTSPAAIAEQNWPFMAALDSEPSPRLAGQAESLRVVGSGAGGWYFLLKTEDEAHNWSPVSNVAAARFSDLEPPGTVTDLTAVSAGLNGVTLRWTAPGDDGGSGRASGYQIRYAEEFITAEVWEGAAAAQGAPAPSPAGSREEVTVTGLTAGTMYFFCVRAADEFENRSALSNVVSSAPAVTRLTTSPASSNFGAQHADWSPDGTSIAFAGDWDERGNVDLYLMPAAGGAAVRLTSDPGLDTHPCWSPDGSRIAFSTNRSGKYEIWTMEPVPGSQAMPLVSLDQDASEPAWGSDSSYIAFIVRTTPVTSAVYVYVNSIGAPPPWAIYEYDSRNSSPVWSPDQTRIAFTSDRDGDDNVWLVRPDNFGSGGTRLTYGAGIDGAPSWSPDGDRLAFHSDHSGDLDIWAMRLDGTELVRLTSGPGNDTFPDWSSDGARIAFTSRRTGQAEIWVLRVQ